MSVSQIIELARRYREITCDHYLRRSYVDNNVGKVRHYTSMMDNYTKMAADCFIEGRRSLSGQFATRADRLHMKINALSEKIRCNISICFELHGQATEILKTFTELAGDLPEESRLTLMRLVSPLGE